MRALIVGGAGFIGANAAAALRKLGAQVTIFDNLSRPGAQFNEQWLRAAYPDITLVRGDIRKDDELLRTAIAHADLVLHEAAQVAVTTSVVDPVTDFEINAVGTLKVLEALRAVNRAQVLIFASTNKVYGGLENHAVVQRNGRWEFVHGGGVREDEPLDFHSPYGCSKGAADQYVRDYARIYGLRTVVFRQSCIYGPHQFGVEDQGWVAWFCINAVLDRPVTIYGDGRQTRDVLYVSDLIEAYLAAYRRIDVASGRIYNMGGGPSNTLSLLELVAQLERRYDRKLQVGFSDWRPGDQRVFVSDVKKAAADLDWRPKVGVAEGINKLCDWIDENRALFLARSLQRV